MSERQHTMKPQQTGSRQSCSCTSCVYTSESESLRRMFDGGSKIDRLYYDKYIPLRERKLIDRLIKTRALYDDVRNRILSSDDSYGKSYEEDSQRNIAINEIVTLVDKGGLAGPKLSECCSCCNCGTTRGRQDKHQRRAMRRHVRGGKHLSTQSSVMPKQRTRENLRPRGVRFKRIRSDPCTCTLKLILSKSKNFLEKSEYDNRQAPNNRAENVFDKNELKQKRPRGRMVNNIEDKITRSVRKIRQPSIKIKNRIEKGTFKSLENLKVARQSIKKKMDSMQTQYVKRHETESTLNIDDLGTIKVKKDSITKYREDLRKKKMEREFECEHECNVEECIPKECLEIMKLRRALRQKLKGSDQTRYKQENENYDHELGSKMIRDSQIKPNKKATKSKKILTKFDISQPKSSTRFLITTSSENQKNTLSHKRKLKGKMRNKKGQVKHASSGTSYSVSTLRKPVYVRAEQSAPNMRIEKSVTDREKRNTDSRKKIYCACDKNTRKKRDKAILNTTKKSDISTTHDLRRCFCTLKLSPFIEEKNKFKDRKDISSQTITNKMANSYTEMNKKRMGNLLPYECEPGVCTPYRCNPYECLTRINERKNNFVKQNSLKQNTFKAAINKNEKYSPIKNSNKPSVMNRPKTTISSSISFKYSKGNSLDHGNSLLKTRPSKKRSSNIQTTIKKSYKIDSGTNKSILKYKTSKQKQIDKETYTINKPGTEKQSGIRLKCICKKIMLKAKYLSSNYDTSTAKKTFSSQTNSSQKKMKSSSSITDNFKKSRKAINVNVRSTNTDKSRKKMKSSSSITDNAKIFRNVDSVKIRDASPTNIRNNKNTHSTDIKTSANQPHRIVHKQTRKPDTCTTVPKGIRQSVSIGSSFSFNIEFFKHRINDNECEFTNFAEKDMRKCLCTTKSRKRNVSQNIYTINKCILDKLQPGYESNFFKKSTLSQYRYDTSSDFDFTEMQSQFNDLNLYRESLFRGHLLSNNNFYKSNFENVYTYSQVCFIKKSRSNVTGASRLLKRCFCTMNVKTKDNLKPYECEPGICLHGDCDINECQQRKYKPPKKTRLEANPAVKEPCPQAIRYKSIPNKSRRQAVRLGSEFRFNIDFAKSKSHYKDRGHVVRNDKCKCPSHNTRKIGYVSSDVDQHIQSEVRSSARKTNTDKLLKKCFCTFKLQKKLQSQNHGISSIDTNKTKYKDTNYERQRPNTRQNQQQSGRSTTYTSSENYLHVTKNKTKNGQDFSKTKHQGNHYLHDPKMISKSRKIKENVTPSSQMSSSRSQTNNLRQVKKRQSIKLPSSKSNYERKWIKLDPNECEPYTCIPGRCNPYECLERIKKRYRNTRNKSISVRAYKNPMSSSSFTFKDKPTTKEKHATVQSCGKPAQYIVEKSTKPSKVSRNKNQQMVRIGSSYSFNVQFCKDKQNENVPNWQVPGDVNYIHNQNIPNRQALGYAKYRHNQNVRNRQASGDANYRENPNVSNRRAPGDANYRQNQNVSNRQTHKPQENSSKILQRNNKKYICGKQYTSNSSNTTKQSKQNNIAVQKSERPNRSKRTHPKHITDKSEIKRIPSKSKYSKNLERLKLQKKGRHPKYRKQSTDKLRPQIPEKKRVSPKITNSTNIKGKSQHKGTAKRMISQNSFSESYVRKPEKKVVRSQQSKLHYSYDTDESHERKPKAVISKRPDLQCSVCSTDELRRHETKSLKSSPSTRSAVKIGSTFSFHIEFYKERFPNTAQIEAAAKALKYKCKKTCTKELNKSRGLKNQKLQVSNMFTDKSQNTLPKTREVKAQANLEKPRCIVIDKGCMIKPPPEVLNPYECELGVCVPGKCDPIKCLSRIQKRHMKDSSTWTRSPKKSVSNAVSTSNTASNKNIQHTEKPQKRKKNKVSKVKRPKSSKKRNREKGHLPSKKCVRLGSSFKFDIEFYKTKSSNNDILNEHKPVYVYRQEKEKKQRVINKHSQSLVPKMQPSFTDAKILKRCYCTLKLQKSNRSVNSKLMTQAQNVYFSSIHNFGPLLFLETKNINLNYNPYKIQGNDVFNSSCSSNIQCVKNVSNDTIPKPSFFFSKKYSKHALMDKSTLQTQTSNKKEYETNAHVLDQKLNDSKNYNLGYKNILAGSFLEKICYTISSENSTSATTIFQSSPNTNSRKNELINKEFPTISNITFRNKIHENITTSKGSLKHSEHISYMNMGPYKPTTKYWIPPKYCYNSSERKCRKIDKPKILAPIYIIHQYRNKYIPSHSVHVHSKYINQFKENDEIYQKSEIIKSLYPNIINSINYRQSPTPLNAIMPKKRNGLINSNTDYISSLKPHSYKTEEKEISVVNLLKRCFCTLNLQVIHKQRRFKTIDKIDTENTKKVCNDSFEGTKGQYGNSFFVYRVNNIQSQLNKKPDDGKDTQVLYLCRPKKFNKHTSITLFGCNKLECNEVAENPYDLLKSANNLSSKKRVRRLKAKDSEHAIKTPNNASKILNKTTSTPLCIQSLACRCKQIFYKRNTLPNCKCFDNSQPNNEPDSQHNAKPRNKNVSLIENRINCSSIQNQYDKEILAMSSRGHAYFNNNQMNPLLMKPPSEVKSNRSCCVKKEITDMKPSKFKKDVCFDSTIEYIGENGYGKKIDTFVTSCKNKYDSGSIARRQKSKQLRDNKVYSKLSCHCQKYHRCSQFPESKRSYKNDKQSNTLLPVTTGISVTNQDFKELQNTNRETKDRTKFSGSLYNVSKHDRSENLEQEPKYKNKKMKRRNNKTQSAKKCMCQKIILESDQIMTKSTKGNIFQRFFKKKSIKPSNDNCLCESLSQPKEVRTKIDFNIRNRDCHNGSKVSDLKIPRKSATYPLNETQRTESRHDISKVIQIADSSPVKQVKTKPTKSLIKRKKCKAHNAPETESEQEVFKDTQFIIDSLPFKHKHKPSEVKKRKCKLYYVSGTGSIRDFSKIDLNVKSSDQLKQKPVKRKSKSINRSTSRSCIDKKNRSMNKISNRREYILKTPQCASQKIRDLKNHGFSNGSLLINKHRDTENYDVKQRHNTIKCKINERKRKTTCISGSSSKTDVFKNYDDNISTKRQSCDCRDSHSEILKYDGAAHSMKCIPETNKITEKKKSFIQRIFTKQSISKRNDTKKSFEDSNVYDHRIPKDSYLIKKKRKSKKNYASVTEHNFAQSHPCCQICQTKAQELRHNISNIGDNPSITHEQKPLKSIIKNNDKSLNRSVDEDRESHAKILKIDSATQCVRCTCKSKTQPGVNCKCHINTSKSTEKKGNILQRIFKKRQHSKKPESATQINENSVVSAQQHRGVDKTNPNNKLENDRKKESFGKEVDTTEEFRNNKMETIPPKNSNINNNVVDKVTHPNKKKSRLTREKRKLKNITSRDNINAKGDIASKTHKTDQEKKIHVQDKRSKDFTENELRPDIMKTLSQNKIKKFASTKHPTLPCTYKKCQEKAKSKHSDLVCGDCSSPKCLFKNESFQMNNKEFTPKVSQDQKRKKKSTKTKCTCHKYTQSKSSTFDKITESKNKANNISTNKSVEFLPRQSKYYLNTDKTNRKLVQKSETQLKLHKDYTKKCIRHEESKILNQSRSKKIETAKNIHKLPCASKICQKKSELSEWVCGDCSSPKCLFKNDTHDAKSLTYTNIGTQDKIKPILDKNLNDEKSFKNDKHQICIHESKVNASLEKLSGGKHKIMGKSDIVIIDKEHEGSSNAIRENDKMKSNLRFQIKLSKAPKIETAITQNKSKKLTKFQSKRLGTFKSIYKQSSILPGICNKCQEKIQLFKRTCDECSRSDCLFESGVTKVNDQLVAHTNVMIPSNTTPVKSRGQALKKKTSKKFVSTKPGQRQHFTCENCLLMCKDCSDSKCIFNNVLNKIEEENKGIKLNEISSSKVSVHVRTISQSKNKIKSSPSKTEKSEKKQHSILSCTCKKCFEKAQLSEWTCSDCSSPECLFKNNVLKIDAKNVSSKNPQQNVSSKIQLQNTVLSCTCKTCMEKNKFSNWTCSDCSSPNCLFKRTSSKGDTESMKDLSNISNSQIPHIMISQHSVNASKVPKTKIKHTSNSKRHATAISAHTRNAVDGKIRHDEVSKNRIDNKNIRNGSKNILKLIASKLQGSRRTFDKQNNICTGKVCQKFSEIICTDCSNQKCIFKNENKPHPSSNKILRLRNCKRHTTSKSNNSNKAVNGKILHSEISKSKIGNANAQNISKNILKLIASKVQGSKRTFHKQNSICTCKTCQRKSQYPGFICADCSNTKCLFECGNLNINKENNMINSILSRNKLEKQNIDSTCKTCQKKLQFSGSLCADCCNQKCLFEYADHDINPKCLFQYAKFDKEKASQCKISEKHEINKYPTNKIDKYNKGCICITCQGKSQNSKSLCADCCNPKCLFECADHDIKEIEENPKTLSINKNNNKHNRACNCTICKKTSLNSESFCADCSNPKCLFECADFDIDEKEAGLIKNKSVCSKDKIDKHVRACTACQGMSQNSKLICTDCSNPNCLFECANHDINAVEGNSIPCELNNNDSKYIKNKNYKHIRTCYCTLCRKSSNSKSFCSECSNQNCLFDCAVPDINAVEGKPISGEININNSKFPKNINDKHTRACNCTICKKDSQNYNSFCADCSNPKCLFECADFDIIEEEADPSKISGELIKNKSKHSKNEIDNCNRACICNDCREKSQNPELLCADCSNPNCLFNCGKRDVNKENEHEIAGDIITNKSKITKKSKITNKSKITKKSNITNKSNIANKSNITNKSNVTNKPNITKKSNITSKSNITNKSKFSKHKIDKHNRACLCALCKKSKNSESFCADCANPKCLFECDSNADKADRNKVSDNYKNKYSITKSAHAIPKDKYKTKYQSKAYFKLKIGKKRWSKNNYVGEIKKTSSQKIQTLCSFKETEETSAIQKHQCTQDTTQIQKVNGVKITIPTNYLVDNIDIKPDRKQISKLFRRKHADFDIYKEEQSSDKKCDTCARKHEYSRTYPPAIDNKKINAQNNMLGSNERNDASKQKVAQQDTFLNQNTQDVSLVSEKNGVKLTLPTNYIIDNVCVKPNSKNILKHFRSKFRGISKSAFQNSAAITYARKEFKNKMKKSELFCPNDDSCSLYNKFIFNKKKTKKIPTTSDYKHKRNTPTQPGMIKLSMLPKLVKNNTNIKRNDINFDKGSYRKYDTALPYNKRHKFDTMCDDCKNPKCIFESGAFDMNAWIFNNNKQKAAQYSELSCKACESKQNSGLYPQGRGMKFTVTAKPDSDYSNIKENVNNVNIIENDKNKKSNIKKSTLENGYSLCTCDIPTSLHNLPEFSQYSYGDSPFQKDGIFVTDQQNDSLNANQLNICPDCKYSQMKNNIKCTCKSQFSSGDQPMQSGDQNYCPEANNLETCQIKCMGRVNTLQQPTRLCNDLCTCKFPCSCQKCPKNIDVAEVSWGDCKPQRMFIVTDNDTVTKGNDVAISAHNLPRKVQGAKLEVLINKNLDPNKNKPEKPYKRNKIFTKTKPEECVQIETQTDITCTNCNVLANDKAFTKKTKCICGAPNCKKIFKEMTRKLKPRKPDKKCICGVPSCIGDKYKHIICSCEPSEADDEDDLFQSKSDSKKRGKKSKLENKPTFAPKTKLRKDKMRESNASETIDTRNKNPKFNEKKAHHYNFITEPIIESKKTITSHEQRDTKLVTVVEDEPKKTSKRNWDMYKPNRDKYKPNREMEAISRSKKTKQYDSKDKTKDKMKKNEPEVKRKSKIKINQSDPKTKTKAKQSDPKTKTKAKQSDPKTKTTTKQSDPKTKTTTKQTDPKTKTKTKQVEPKTGTKTKQSDPKAKTKTKQHDPKAKMKSKQSEPKDKTKIKQLETGGKARAKTKQSEPKAKTKTKQSEPKAKTNTKQSKPKDKTKTKQLETGGKARAKTNQLSYDKTKGSKGKRITTKQFGSELKTTTTTKTKTKLLEPGGKTKTPGSKSASKSAKESRRSKHKKSKKNRQAQIKRKKYAKKTIRKYVTYVKRKTKRKKQTAFQRFLKIFRKSFKRKKKPIVSKGNLIKVKDKVASTSVVKGAKSTLEAHFVTNFILHFFDKDPRRRFRPIKKIKPQRKEPVDFECSLFMGSLRKRPWLSIYYMCPWFYPHCVSILNVWRQFTDVILFLLAVAVWSPCILAIEICRAFVCCAFCTG
ncbi:uncharacterized protein LOC128683122 [Plodia interpunctella]|uniref:uncharacterized protein LOC128683122 n=1 Tax=Plodia interpunctella TaxID=58824 RepID=UPI002368035C|nr:uncharacterized protein LOC128683122 [Plodia interpunctella]